jgi:hypothetical protein
MDSLTYTMRTVSGKVQHRQTPYISRALSRRDTEIERDVCMHTWYRLETAAIVYLKWLIVTHY